MLCPKIQVIAVINNRETAAKLQAAVNNLEVGRRNKVRLR